MFKFILEYLPILICSIILYHTTAITINLSKWKQEWDWNKLVTGIIKTLQICGSFILFGLIFDKISNIIPTDTVLQYAPDTLMGSAIVYYSVKGLKNMIELMGLSSDDIITLKKKEVIEIPIENEIKG